MNLDKWTLITYWTIFIINGDQWNQRVQYLISLNLEFLTAKCTDFIKMIIISRKRHIFNHLRRRIRPEFSEFLSQILNSKRILRLFFFRAYLVNQDGFFLEIHCSNDMSVTNCDKTLKVKIRLKVTPFILCILKN